MTTAHCFKKVAVPVEPVAMKPKSIRERVKEYGDDWSLLGGCDGFAMAQFATRVAGETFDSREARAMLRMERGEKCRCGDE